MRRLHIITFNSRKLIFFAYGFIILFAIMMINFIFLTSLTAPISVFSQENGKTAKLAIIIDDFGESREGVKEMMALDQPLTFAIMPFLTHSTEDAENAFKNNHEVIIHLAMEPIHGKPSWLGPRPIMNNSSDEVITKIVTDAFENVPHAVGANIHMGSRASANELVMNSVLNVIGAHKCYFVDSKTSEIRPSIKLSNEKGIPCFENNVFLDSTQSRERIRSQLIKAANYALEHEKAIAIGHVGADGGVVTAQTIKDMLPTLEDKGVKLVYVSDLLK